MCSQLLRHKDLYQLQFKKTSFFQALLLFSDEKIFGLPRFLLINAQHLIKKCKDNEITRGAAIHTISILFYILKNIFRQRIYENFFVTYSKLLKLVVQTKKVFYIL